MTSQPATVALPPNTPPLSDAAHTRINEILQADEHLIWVGQPNAFRLWSQLALTAIGNVAGIFVLLWFANMAGIIEQGWRSLVLFFAVAAVLVTIMPIAVRTLLALQALYLLTTERAVIAGPKLLGYEFLIAFSPDKLRNTKCQQVLRGVGDLMFAPATRLRRLFWGFVSIRNPHYVQRLIATTLLNEYTQSMPGFAGDSPPIATTPISRNSASYSTRELVRAGTDEWHLATTAGARNVGLIVLIFGLATGVVGTILYFSGEYERIGRFNGTPLGGYALLAIFALFAAVLPVAGLTMMFDPPIRFNRTLRTVQGGYGPFAWSYDWDQIHSLQAILGRYVRVKGKGRNYQTYELNLVLNDGAFSRRNLICDTDRAAQSDFGRTLADFLDKPLDNSA